MVKQSIETNHIILGAAQFVAETQRAKGEEATPALLVAYDLLRAIGVPTNGLGMLFGQLADVLEPVEIFPARNQLKCQLCEDTAQHLVKTQGQTVLAVCHKCGEQLESMGAVELL